MMSYKINVKQNAKKKMLCKQFESISIYFIIEYTIQNKCRYFVCIFQYLNTSKINLLQD